MIFYGSILMFLLQLRIIREQLDHMHKCDWKNLGLFRLFTLFKPSVKIRRRVYCSVRIKRYVDVPLNQSGQGSVCIPPVSCCISLHSSSWQHLKLLVIGLALTASQVFKGGMANNKSTTLPEHMKGHTLKWERT